MSIWSPVAARRPSRSSPRCAASRRATLCRDRRIDFQQVRRPRYARQYRRVHRDHGAGHRNGGRRATRQGDHHSQSGRAAADHARYGVHALARRRPNQIEDSIGLMVEQVQRLCAGLPAQAEGAVRAHRPQRSDPHSRPGRIRGRAFFSVPRGRGRGALFAGLCRKSRYHDLGGIGHGRPLGRSQSERVTR